MKKRFFSLILSFVLLFIMCSPALAYDYNNYDNVIITGDVSADDIVGLDDAIGTLRHTCEISALTEEQLVQADVNRDNAITTDDAVIILKLAAGIQDGYPKEYTPWEITEEPTCYQEGTVSSYCLTDDTVSSYKIDKVDHQYYNGECIFCFEPQPTPHIKLLGKELDFGATDADIKAVLGSPTETLKSDNVTFLVYNSNPQKIIITASTSEKGLCSLYTTNKDITLLSTDESINISSATDTQYSINGISARFYFDNIGTKKAYAAIYSSDYFRSLDVNAKSNILTHEKLVFHCTNTLRSINGLSLLSYDSAVSDVARNHSKDMAKNNYFSHTNPNNLSPGDRLDNANIKWMSYGENIIGGYMSAFEMADGWYNSEGHRANMLRTYFTHLGVGIYYTVNSTYRCYGTQNFVSYH